MNLSLKKAQKIIKWLIYICYALIIIFIVLARVTYKPDEPLLGEILAQLTVFVFYGCLALILVELIMIIYQSRKNKSAENATAKKPSISTAILWFVLKFGALFTFYFYTLWICFGGLTE